MAEVKETVVFEVDVSAYEQSLVGLTKSINELKVQQKDFQEQTKKGVEGAAVAYEKVTAQLKVQQQEYRTTQAVLVGVEANKKKLVDTTNFENNSIQANRDLLKQLTAQYINVQKPTAEFTNRIKSLSDTLKKQESVIGDNRRNVGNYAESFQSVLGALSGVIPGLKGFETAQLGINAAMKANPIGLVVTAIQFLTSALQFFGPVIDKIEQSVAAFGAGFGALINGGNLVEAARQAAQLTAELQDLEDAQNGINISNAEADARIAKLLLQLRNRNITEQEAGKILAKLADEDEKRLKKNLEFEKALLKSKEEKFLATTNLTKTELDALVERSKVESEINERGLAEIMKVTGFTREQAIERLRINEREQKELADLAEGKVRQNKEELDAEVKLIAEQRLKVINVETESALLKEKIENRTAQVEEKFAQERERRAREAEAAAKKAEAEREKAAQKQIELAKKQEQAVNQTFENERTRRAAQLSIEADSLDKRLKLFDLAFEKEEEALRAAGETEENITIIRNKRIRDIEEGYYNERLTAEERYQKEKLKAIADADEEVRRSMKEAADMRRKEQEEIKGFITQTSDYISEILGSVSAFINQAASENIEALNEQVKSGAITQKQFDAETRAIKLKAWKQSKAIAITQAVMNTANAVMAQLSNPTPYVGIVLAALAAASGALQIALIAKQQPPKFKAGGGIPIDGKSHEQGGTPIHVNGELVAEAEKGEGLFVMKKDAYQDLHMLSTWNQKYGGRSWLGGGVKFAQEGGKLNLPTSDGGFATREISNQVQTTELMAAAIRDGFTKAPAPELSIVEFTTKTKRRNRSVNISEL